MTKKESKAKMKAVKVIEPKEVKPIKLDLGCGKNKKGADWIGVDVIDFEGVDLVMNVDIWL